MSESKWTPGPWVQCIVGDEIVILPAGRPGEVTSVEVSSSSDEANARLITTAPEMAEFLEWIVESPWPGADANGIMWRATELLAKARGED